MRAKPSFTASGMYSCSGPFTPPLPIHVALPGLSSGVALLGGTGPASVRGEGLLHDARNLMGTLGLYCDLLSMPDVLKPEHRQYADDLRLVGTRSGALIEHLIEHLAQSHANEGTLHPVKPVSLRGVVERCSGLLSRVADGCAIEVGYGEAAAAPVGVAEEAVERILVNLVRNSAAAMRGKENLRAIRVGVGLLENRVGEPKSRSFRRVRLTVEDSGCGMAPEQQRLLCSGRTTSRDGHGIGFGVVQELVGASGGDLRVKSVPGIGTRVQIEWPVAPASTAARATGSIDSPASAGRWASC